MVSWHREEVWIVVPNDPKHEIRVFKSVEEANEYSQTLKWDANLKRGYYHSKHQQYR